MRCFLSVLFVMIVGVVDASAMDVTSCQVVVPHGEVGVLQNDIDCGLAHEGPPFAAITLERGAVLDLNGFTVDHFNLHLLAGVGCEGRCEVRGPGRIVSSTLGVGVLSFGHSPVLVSDVDIEDEVTGVLTPFAKTTLRNVTIHASRRGAEIDRRIADGLTVELGPDGAACIDTSQSSASWVRGKDVTLIGCQIGIGENGSVDLTNLTVTGASSGGVSVRRKLRLVDSTVTGSGDIDLISKKTPTLVNTTCGTSAVWGKNGITGANFGMCAND